MSKHYRIGIVGIGGISTMHAKAIGDLPNATLVAGVCRTPERGRKFAAEFNCNWHPTVEKMLDADKPDVVTIATPSGAHLEPAKACAARGVHVLCEKPLEINTARVDEMIAAANKGGIVLGGVFQSRFDPALNVIRQAVAEGRFGRIAIGAVYTPWWRDDAYYSPDRWQGTLALDGGGALINQSIHGVDALQWLVGAADNGGSVNPVAEVTAYTDKRGHPADMIEVEDTAVALLRFRSGALGQILAATSMYPGTNRRLMIAGRDGTAEVIENELSVFSFRDPRDEDQAALEKFSTRSTTTGASDPLAIDYTGHTRNIGAFLDTLDTGAAPAIDGPQGRLAVEIVESIYESARTGRPVKLP